MNWGKWIVVAFILFAAFIATLVTVCVREDISLVSKEYYKDELAYQDQIQRLNNTAQLQQKPVVRMLAHKFLEIEFKQPSNVEGGTLKLFCPSNESMDKNFIISKDNLQVFDMNDLQSGMYKAKLHWTMQGKEFYLEQIINI